jgi:ADP-ribose pyrophosphatase
MSATNEEAIETDALRETCLHTERVFEGILLNIDRARVRLPDGRETQREYIRHPGAVVVIALRRDGRIVFERQFRYPLRRAFLELPAGKIDPGEDILAAARRELREETGFEATEWRHIGVTHPCIGYSDERIDIFLAKGLTETGQALEEGEFLELLSLKPADALTAARDGHITDGKTLAALLIAQPFLS